MIKSNKVSRMQHQNNSENNNYNFDVWAAQVKRQLIAALNKKKAR
jgi:hypothetical protein